MPPNFSSGDIAVNEDNTNGHNNIENEENENAIDSKKVNGNNEKVFKRNQIVWFSVFRIGLLHGLFLWSLFRFPYVVTVTNYSYGK